MTTESHHSTPTPAPAAAAAPRLLAGAALGTLVLGRGRRACSEASSTGRAAAYGALVGTAVVVAVFGLGSLVVDRVAGAAAQRGRCWSR